MNIKNIQIKSLENLSIDQLFIAFENAFSDYEMQINMMQLEKMIKRRGYRADLSFGAFNGDKLVSFTFNGVGKYNDIPTAYDTGTGTIKQYRGRGLAKEIFLHSIPHLKTAGIKQYLLEVLQHNEAAFKLYQKLNFEIVSEFNYYITNKMAVVLPSLSLGEKYSVNTNIDYNAIKKFEFWDYIPSWQNNFESISRQQVSFESLGIYLKNKLIAYSIFEPAMGDITQFAVHKEYRRLGLASNLMKFTLNRIITDEIQIINTDSKCTSLNYFLDRLQIKKSGKQYEMLKVL